MKPKLLFLTIIATITSSIVYAQVDIAPAIWLKADDTGIFDRLWQDVSGNERHALFSEDTTKLRFGQLINYNPSISFAALPDSMYIRDYTISDKLFLKAFVVFKNDTSGQEKFIWGTANTTHHKLLVSNMNIYDEFNRFSYDFGKTDKPVLAAASKYWDKLNPGEFSNLFLGGSIDNDPENAFRGEIAEFIVFDRETSQEENLVIISYLALKYGIGLMQTSYVDSDANVIWNIESNTGYDKGIFGIARDDKYALNQKQAANAYGVLSVSANEFYLSNDENPSMLQDKSFILFSNNGEEPIEGLSAHETENTSMLFNTCKWKVNTTGINIEQIPTSLKVNRKKMFEDSLSTAYLVIDNGGDGTYTTIETILPDSTNENGDMFFSELSWGENGSTDYFTFALHANLKAEIESFPPLCADALGTISCSISGGEKPYNIKLYNKDIGKEYVYEWNENLLEVDTLPAGMYLVDINDNGSNRYKAEANIRDLNTDLLSSLNLFYYIHSEPLQLSIEDIPGYSISQYSWKYNDQELSNTREATINAEGSYQITIKTAENCEYSKIFYVGDLRESTDEGVNENEDNNTDEEENITGIDLGSNKENNIRIYPNPTHNGNYTIAFDMETPTDFVIDVSSINGKRIKLFELENRTKDEYKGTIAKQGVYMVAIYSDNKKVFAGMLIVE